MPHPKAHVLVDRFLDDSSQRHGQDLVQDRPALLADIARLPFQDGAFDYVICSHVLEHTDDVEAAARELSRVAKRGYVETPSELWELLFGWEFHTYAVSLIDDRLVFKRKRSVEPPLGRLGYALAEHEPMWVDIVDNHPELFYVSIEWEGKLRVEVPATFFPDDLSWEAYVDVMRDVRPTVRQASRALARATLPERLLQALRGSAAATPFQRKARGSELSLKPAKAARPRPVDLDSILACPACRTSGLRHRVDGVSCSGCGRDFERRGSVLDLVVDSPTTAPTHR